MTIDVKDYVPVLISSITIESAPLGTHAPSFGGGHWEKVKQGWKWCSGSTFPRPGGDWNGKLIPPATGLKIITEEAYDALVKDKLDWIDFKLERPEPRKAVLVILRDDLNFKSGVVAAELDSSGLWFFADNDYPKFFTVMAWMYLPSIETWLNSDAAITAATQEASDGR